MHKKAIKQGAMCKNYTIKIKNAKPIKNIFVTLF